jgi:hypothetical protein
MYSTVITFKDDLPQDVLNEAVITCEKAFNNRAGHVYYKQNDNPYCLIFEGDEKDYGCLQLGIISLDRANGFKNYVAKWDWIDEEPNESGDVLEALAIPVY